MNAFEVVAIIMAIFFGVGVAVGCLFVMALPVLGRARRDESQGVDESPEETPGQLDAGPPGTEPGTVPDDRDDPGGRPWWDGVR